MEGGFFAGGFLKPAKGFGMVSGGAKVGLSFGGYRSLRSFALGGHL